MSATYPDPTRRYTKLGVTDAWRPNVEREFSAAARAYREGRATFDPNGRNEESLPRVIERFLRVGTRPIERVDCSYCGEDCSGVDNLALGILTHTTHAPWATISGPRAVECDDGLWICNVCVERENQDRAEEAAQDVVERAAWESGAS